MERQNDYRSHEAHILNPDELQHVQHPATGQFQQHQAMDSSVPMRAFHKPYTTDTNNPGFDLPDQLQFNPEQRSFHEEHAQQSSVIFEPQNSEFHRHPFEGENPEQPYFAPSNLNPPVDQNPQNVQDFLNYDPGHQTSDVQCKGDVVTRYQQHQQPLSMWAPPEGLRRSPRLREQQQASRVDSLSNGNLTAARPPLFRSESNTSLNLGSAAPANDQQDPQITHVQRSPAQFIEPPKLQQRAGNKQAGTTAPPPTTNARRSTRGRKPKVKNDDFLYY